jgi:segregation and condensation protein A
MVAITTDNRAAFTYRLRLPTFEGPLDVLLRLIEREQLPITDVSLVMVSDQFLTAARKIGESQPESVAEFAAVGARLVLLKARSLLPRKESIQDDEEPSDLVVQLIEYRAIKQAASEFAVWEKQGTRAFAKGTQAVDLPERAEPLPLARHEPSALARAIGRRLAGSVSTAHAVAVRPLISLRVMMGRLLGGLGRQEMLFQDISARECESAEQERALFLALLILVRRNVLDAEQSKPFGPIIVRRFATGVDTLLDDMEEF